MLLCRVPTSETRDRPFFARPDFFPSPEKSYALPPYAEGVATTLASASASSPSYPFVTRRKACPIYIDDMASESSEDS